MLDTIALALLPVFFVMALGYAAGRFGRIGGEHVPALNAFVMEFALPAALFVGTASASLDQLRRIAPASLVLAGAMIVPYALWYALERWRGRDMGDAATLALSVALPNFAAAGLPIVAAVAGQEGTTFIALTIAAGALIPSPVTLVLLEMSRPDGVSRGGVPSRVARAFAAACAKPVVWAPMIGVLLAVTGLSLPIALLAAIKLIGQVTAGAALFLTGLVVSLQHFRLTWPITCAVVVANVLQPLLCYAIAAPLHLPWDVARLTILCYAMPSGFFGILFAIGYGRPSADSGSIVLASTIASAVTLSVTLALLFPS